MAMIDFDELTRRVAFAIADGDPEELKAVAEWLQESGEVDALTADEAVAFEVAQQMNDTPPV
jgi:hypothetical protein